MVFKYQGILAKPRRYDPGPGLLASDEQRAAWIASYKAEHLKLWRALFEAHGVAWGDESELLWRLAETHVDGFKMQGRSGPKVLWDEVTKAKLRIAVEEYRAQRTRPTSVAQACSVLAKREPWATMLRKGGKPGEALRGHYNTASLVWVELVRQARAWDALPAHEKDGHDVM